MLRSGKEQLPDLTFIGGVVNDPLGSTFPAGTFIVRVWLEWTEKESYWRGQILHIQSGQRIGFLSLDEMLKFIQTWAAMPKADQRELPRAE
jgi:hypothetical protein